MCTDICPYNTPKPMNAVCSSQTFGKLPCLAVSILAASADYTFSLHTVRTFVRTTCRSQSRLPVQIRPSAFLPQELATGKSCRKLYPSKALRFSINRTDICPYNIPKPMNAVCSSQTFGNSPKVLRQASLAASTAHLKPCAFP